VVLQTALFGPVAEELLFRGLIFARCLRVLGAIPAYAIGAALFGAMHFDSRSNFSLERMWTMAISSVYHCALYKWSGTLLAPTAWHVANNSFMVFNDALCSPMVRLTIECTGAHSAFGRITGAERWALDMADASFSSISIVLLLLICVYNSAPVGQTQ
jgi:membrane protease YdiL (CAAX protease family)